ncbi:hypothetical protein BHE74_00031359 [Ensete ventricosum]|nr:hypothetical protein BHE74_00031359 [Ensete ventricosum]RZS18004.1 hypothetical protein BHM03_00050210 [Ensete ventricosum]
MRGGDCDLEIDGSSDSKVMRGGGYDDATRTSMLWRTERSGAASDGRWGNNSGWGDDKIRLYRHDAAGAGGEERNSNSNDSYVGCKGRWGRSMVAMVASSEGRRRVAALASQLRLEAINGWRRLAAMAVSGSRCWSKQ